MIIENCENGAKRKVSEDPDEDMEENQIDTEVKDQLNGLSFGCFVYLYILCWCWCLWFVSCN